MAARARRASPRRSCRASASSAAGSSSSGTTTYRCSRRLPAYGLAPSPLRITYLDGHGVLREVLARVTAAGFDVSDLSFNRLSEEEGGDPRAVAVRLEVRGRHPLTELVSELGELEGVLAVHVADANADPD